MRCVCVWRCQSKCVWLSAIPSLYVIGGWMMAGGLGVSVVGGLVAMVIRSNLRVGEVPERPQEYDRLTPITSTVRSEAVV